jgi:hypothetical protein
MFFLEAQPFFERKTVWLIHLEADISLADPVTAFGDAQGSVFGGNLLDGHGDLHWLDPRA